MKSVNFNNIIQFFLCIYIITLYIFTYIPGLNLISNALALFLIFLIWINFLFIRKRLFFNNFIILYGLFLFISIVSAFFAINIETSLEKVKTLVILNILVFSLINYIDSINKVKKLISYFIIAGFIASIYILLTSDFSQLTRYGADLGNVNAIGLLIGFSTIFCFYFLIEERKLWLLPILFLMFTVILLTGSRKAFMFILLCLTLVTLSKLKKGIASKVKTIIIASSIIMIALYLIFNIPLFYEIVGYRMNNLLLFINGETVNEGSVYIRANMIELGYSLFIDRPFTGYGIDNFRHLYGGAFGTYSHNNFIELMVGTGIFGLVTFYLTHLVILKDLLVVSKGKNYKTLAYVFGSIIIAYIILSVGLIYYYDKQITIILGVSSILINLASQKKLQNKRSKIEE